MFKEAIESFNQLYVEMSQNIIKESENNQAMQAPGDHMQGFKQELDTFKKYNNIMFKLVQYQDVDAKATTIPKWMEMMIQCSKTEYTKICLVSVEVFIKIIDIPDIYNADREQQLQDVGRSNYKQDKYSTVMQIQRLIADAKGTSGKFSDKVMKNVKNFKQEFLSLMQEKGGEGNGHCKDIIQNLWSLLD